MALGAGNRGSRKGCPNHSVELKRRLAALACAPGVSVARIALEHGLNANLLFKWRRQYRAGLFGAWGDTQAVAVAQTAPAVALLPVVETQTMRPAAAGEEAPCIEVVFRCATVRVRGRVERAQLEMVLDNLGRRA